MRRARKTRRVMTMLAAIAAMGFGVGIVGLALFFVFHESPYAVLGEEKTFGGPDPHLHFRVASAEHTRVWEDGDRVREARGEWCFVTVAVRSSAMDREQSLDRIGIEILGPGVLIEPISAAATPTRDRILGRFEGALEPGGRETRRFVFDLPAGVDAPRVRIFRDNVFSRILGRSEHNPLVEQIIVPLESDLALAPGTNGSG